MRRKPTKVRLIDDTDFLVQRAKLHVEKDEPEFRSDVHKAWIQGSRCLGCSACRPAIEVEAAHLRMWTGHNKGGATPDDFWMWPGCPRCHRGIQHQIGEPAFWNGRLGIIDPPHFVLVHFALLSPCPKTVIAGRAELERRYAA